MFVLKVPLKPSEATNPSLM